MGKGVDFIDSLGYFISIVWLGDSIIKAKLFSLSFTIVIFVKHPIWLIKTLQKLQYYWLTIEMINKIQ